MSTVIGGSSFSPSGTKLSVFAATTSAELATVLSDETGDGGGFVRANNATLVAPTLGAATCSTLTASGRVIPASSQFGGEGNSLGSASLDRWWTSIYITGGITFYSGSLSIAKSGSNVGIVGGGLTVAGDLISSVAGNGLQIQSGTGARAGTATLVGGTKTVTNTTVGATSHILLSASVDGGTVGNLSYTISNGASFTINSSNVLDTSAVEYLIYEIN